jgi:hypothetical protein
VYCTPKTILFPIDGACHRVAPEATAFAYREARFATVFGPSWRHDADDAANMEWGRRYYERCGRTRRRAVT